MESNTTYCHECGRKVDTSVEQVYQVEAGYMDVYEVGTEDEWEDFNPQDLVGLYCSECLKGGV